MIKITVTLCTYMMHTYYIFTKSTIISTLRSVFNYRMMALRMRNMREERPKAIGMVSTHERTTPSYKYNLYHMSRLDCFR